MMRVLFNLLILIQLSACASSDRKPTSIQNSLEMPVGALSLERALSEGLSTTLPYLKARISRAASDSSGAYQVPDSIRNPRVLAENSKDKTQLRVYLRKFHKLGFIQKINQAQNLIVGFQCSLASESQAMGLTLERDFPDWQAQALSEILHQKVVQCDISTKEESYIRLAVFAIQKQSCDQALQYLSQIPADSRLVQSDRRAYLEGFCHPVPAFVASRNPWGGYGIRLGESRISESRPGLWFLSAVSGNQVWDELLRKLITLAEKKEFNQINTLAGQIDFEKFRHLNYPFQASVLTLFHEAKADLSVFHTLHRFLSDNPQLISIEMTGLLFPVRFWSEIQSNSSGDPILVKALIRQESAFNPTARSPAKAFGLMQLIFPTAKRFGVHKRKDLLDPVTNIRAGSRFLDNLIRRFGSVELALAAYNAGPVVVEDWIKRYPTTNIDLFVEMIPYSETREYVRLVTRNYKIYKNLLIEKQVQTPGLAVLGK